VVAEAVAEEGMEVGADTAAEEEAIGAGTAADEVAGVEGEVGATIRTIRMRAQRQSTPQVACGKYSRWKNGVRRRCYRMPVAVF
jgi:hypothetical protein